MKETKLNEARIYEEKCGAEISPLERPLFHITPTVGWMNDPNGFSFYQGEYHLFYQYYPYDLHWNAPYWGHLKSRDFIKWERLPAALAPDRDYDGQGVFSGSAVEMSDGRHLLMYTGVQGKDQTPECHQTQCMAVGDGVNYEKYEKNPVITTEEIPEECFAKDFRDPKIWRDPEDGCYYAVVGLRVADGSGAIPLFSSKDGFQWKYVTVLDYCRNQYGRMWECPDFFSLGEKYLLIISPQEMLARGIEFHNGNEVICLVGDYDRKSHSFAREKIIAVDYGLDFYAPQTLETQDGRRILIAWMQAWESSRFCPEGAKWNGMYTIPRELSYSDGRLIQKPVRELENYRGEAVIYREVEAQGCVELPGISGRVLDMTVEFRPKDGECVENFTVYLAQSQEYEVSVIYDSRKNTLCVDRTKSGYPYDIVCRREAPVRNRGGEIKLRIIMDRFSVEIFVNEGEQVMSSVVYTPQSAEGISFEVSGKGWLNVEKYEILA